MITADLMKNRMFPDFELMAGGGGLNREITAVSVIDAPDVDNWMRGGEFLIGSWYIFREAPEEFIPFLLRADMRGIGAVGIKLDRYHHHISPDIIDAAESINLPMFSIPLNYRWTDVIELVHNFLAQEKQGTGYDMGSFIEGEMDHTRLMCSFAVQLRRHLFVTSEQLGLKHRFSPDGEVREISPSERTQPLQEKPLAMRGQVVGALELHGSGEPVWSAVYRMSANPAVAIRVELSPREQTPSTRQERMVLRAMAMLRAEALEMTMQSSPQMARLEKFFEGLCLGVYSDQEMVQANLEELGVRIPPYSRIAMVAPLNESDPPAWQPQVPMGYRLGSIWIGLIPMKDRQSGPPEDYESAAKRHKLFITFGRAVQNASDINRSYLEARRTLLWARNFSLEPGVYQYEELSLYALLDSLHRMPESAGVWSRYWEPMEGISCTQRRSISLKDMMVALIGADFNARLCASRLHLHYNTVRNYIEEAEEVMEIDLQEPHHRLGVTLGYYIQKSRRRNEPDMLSTPIK